MTTSEQTRTSDEWATLTAKRDQAQTKVAEVEHEWREAVEAGRAASAELTALEQRSLDGEKVTAAARREAEQTLTAAQARAAEPWKERREAALAHDRDVKRELGRFARAHLRELVRVPEADAAEACQDELAAAAALVAAHGRRVAAEREISSLAVAGGYRPTPSSVMPRTNASDAVSACSRLLHRGEPAPTLQELPGETAEAAA